ncbi:hypothetical protein QR685DRAFT_186649 [Neurospora intermedia]|uniref:Vacuolar ATPase assembly protein VMA22 n=1 Tax=Neurospora intermedia TaxID=5142 RepID=A0ABR3DMC4_NEUIN
MTTTNPHLPLQDATASPSSPTEEGNPYNTQIDALLTRYLHLLDEYTTLRSSLSSLQAGMYQNLARANFTAERGVRYGKEYFDERMVASRRVVVKVGKRKGNGKGKGKGDEKEEEKEEEEEGHGGEDEGEQKAEFGVGVVGVDEVEVVKEKKEEEEEEGVKQNEEKNAKKESEEVLGKHQEAKKEVIQKAGTTATTPTPTTPVSPDDSSETPSNPDNDTEDDKEDETKKKKIRRKNDPLRWFGLLTPLPLRLAQTQAIQAVEQIIPRLVTVNAEMAQVEIEVRRARKRREKEAAVKAKAKAAATAKDAK